MSANFRISPEDLAVHAETFAQRLEQAALALREAAMHYRNNAYADADACVDRVNAAMDMQCEHIAQRYLFLHYLSLRENAPQPTSVSLRHG